MKDLPRLRRELSCTLQKIKGGNSFRIPQGLSAEFLYTQEF